MNVKIVLPVITAVLVCASGCAQSVQKCTNEENAEVARLYKAASDLNEEVLIAISHAQWVRRLEEKLVAQGQPIDPEEKAAAVIEAMILDMAKRGWVGLECLAELESRRRGQLHTDKMPLPSK